MKASGPIITLSHTTSPRSYVRMAMGEVLMRYKWSVAAPITLAIAGLLAVSAITADIRYSIIALMMIFIVLPGLLALVYFSVAITPTVALCVLPRHFVIEPNKNITVVYEPRLSNGETMQPKTPLTVNWGEIINWKRAGNATLAITDKYTLIIPDSALPCSPYTVFPVTEY